MTSQSNTATGRIVLCLVIIAGVIVAFLVWERRGRPGVSPGKVSVPNDAAARLKVFQRLCEGKTQAGRNKHAEALAIFEEILQAETDPNSHYRWDADIQAAHSMGYLGQHDESLARFDRIIAQCPLREEFPKARLAKADVYSLAGRHDVAIKAFEDLIADYTDVLPLVCEDALEGMREVYTRTGQPGLVRAALDRLITDYPGAENIKRMWALQQTAALREEMRGLQKPRIDRLLAEQKAKGVDKLSGGLTAWAAAEGPYLVTQPLVVAPDATLQVEAGTEVRFGVLGSLTVKGKLEASGTQDKPVRLVPLSDDPTRDWWAGVKFAGGKGGNASHLSHCLVLGAEIGVSAGGGTVELDHCKFDRCGQVSVQAARDSQLKMTHCEVTGGYRLGVEGTPGAALQMADCTIIGLTTHGVLLQEVAGGSSLLRCRIERCGWDGVQARGKCSPRIEDCQIRNNGRNGINAVEGASPTIVNTPVENNAKVGIQMEQRWEGSIRGNAIVGNGGGGIAAEVRCNGQIVDNLVEGNGVVGLRLRLDCTPAVTGNRFFRNKGPGLLLQNSQPRELKNNQFAENSGAAVRNEGSGAVQAADNWWGTTNEQKIIGMIEDRRVDPTWGEVTFRPWLTKAPASQASWGTMIN